MTASPPRGRRGGLTPEVVRDRRHRRENESGRRTTLVAQWGGVTLAKSSRCEVRSCYILIVVALSLGRGVRLLLLLVLQLGLTRKFYIDYSYFPHTNNAMISSWRGAFTFRSLV